MKKWKRILHQPCLPMGADGKKLTESKEHTEFSRKAACEGMVLLENRNQTLPLKRGERVVLLGSGQIDYVMGGTGSGAVYTSYKRNVYDGFKIKAQEGKLALFDELSEFYKKNVEQQYEDKKKRYEAYTKEELAAMSGYDRAIASYLVGLTEEPEIPEALLQKAVAYADTAIVVIKRVSGEGWDRTSEKGDFYLTDAEQRMIDFATANFEKTIVVLNVGGIIDSEFFKNNESIGAVLLAWQSGIEGGLAIADILCGDETPSGKLVDTFVKSFDDYPSSRNFHEDIQFVNYTDDIYVGYRYFETVPGAAEKVNYPFGYGLSYTDFRLSSPVAEQCGEEIKVHISVTNTGECAGKEVVQVYTSAPQGKLGKPAKELRAFKKTRLLQPGETQELELSFAVQAMASFDDLGKIQKSAYVLEAGAYTVHVGNSVRNTKACAFVYTVEKDTAVRQLTQRAAPSELKERMTADGTMEPLPSVAPFVNTRHSEKPQVQAPAEKADFIKVYAREITLDEFMAQLSIEELISLIGGKTSRGVTNTGCMGGLDAYGVPFVPVADGPSGVRIEVEDVYATAWPIPTAMACSWNEALVEKMGELGAKELKENNMGVWLTPGLNIHRNALCGRNFEYYSEDPFIAGKMAAAEIRGIQSQGVGASAKHFACNNKETGRTGSDSRVSERALREIYLKGFEIVVKESAPFTIMSGYNKLNGLFCSENYDLLTGILREEWGFDGMVTSDWGNGASQDKEIMAGNDIRMWENQMKAIHTALEKGEITEGDIYARAKRVLEMVLRLA